MSLFNKIKSAYNKNQAMQEEGKQQLLKGDLGLKKTFWGYWFLIMLVINVLLFFTERRFHILFLNAASLYVGITALIAIKNTLNSTNKLWGITALVIVSLSVIVDALAFIGIVFE
ncbi:conserved membrane hypothetical protein [Enterobacterales bacterium 8AC]|nr:conserved membrane hypothetical protein [Enterobacterales bacterium 8AC]